MEIDTKVEPRVREILAALVARDPERLNAAMGALSEGDDVVHGVELATAVVTVVLAEIYHGDSREDELHELAKDIAEQEEWLQPDPHEIELYLNAVAYGQPIPKSLGPEQLVVLSFLSAAFLLAGRSEAQDRSQWSHHLDRVEAVIKNPQ